MTRWIAICCLGLVVPLMAQDEALHRLADGTIVEGRAKRAGETVVLRTPFGDLHLDAKEYGGVTQPELAAIRHQFSELTRYRKVGDLAERRVLAAWCRDRGLWSALAEELEQILARDLDDDLARGFLSAWAPKLTVHASDLGSRDRDRRDLIDELFAHSAPASNVAAVIAAEKLSRLAPELTLDPAVRGLRAASPRVRWVAARVLAAHTGPAATRRVRPLFELSLRDGSWPIRREAVRALRAGGVDLGLGNLYAQQLDAPDAIVRVRSAQALGELGDSRSVSALISALAVAWKPARATFVSVQQIAYIKDYDVEVAQSAFIADPVVDVVQDGVALEAAIISVRAERLVYVQALQKITRLDLGERAEAWRERFPAR